MSTVDDVVAVQVFEVMEALQAAIGADGVGLMLLDGDGRLGVVGASTPTMRALEQAQAEWGDGPGFETLRTGEPVVLEDLETSPWNDLRQWMPAGQIRSVVAIPLTVADLPAGNLNVIGHQVRRWSQDDVTRIEAAAAAVSSLLQVAATMSQTSAEHRPARGLGDLASNEEGWAR